MVCLIQSVIIPTLKRGRYGGDRMVAGFTTTYAIVVYHH